VSDSDALDAAERSPPLPRAALTGLLRERYGLPDRAVALRLLSREWGKRIYRVSLSPGAPAADAAPRAGRPALPWVVRIYPSDERLPALTAQAALLAFLEGRGYGAARPVPAVDGAPLADLPGGPRSGARRPVLVTTYVPGRSTGLSLPGLRAHGAAVGRLHALASLPPAASPRSPAASPFAALPAASMLPPAELRAALSWLDACRRNVPLSLGGQFDALEAACHALCRFEDAPRVLLHNDCHPWNSVRQADGGVVLIDWEGAGPGPAAIDLGFAALSADTGGLPGPILPPEPARLAALLDGYAPHHRLSPVELEHLPDAVRFRALIAACDRFARAVAAGTPPDDRPWRRYLAAGDLAERIRSRLA
jgi:Ser/Thr protein kinase RdoA (MazF antagonist)